MSKFSDEQFRSDAAELIARTIRDCGTKEPHAVRLALFKVWPTVKHIPPLIWTSEIDKAMGSVKAAAVEGPQQESLWD